MSISPKQQPLFIRSQLWKANGRSPTLWKANGRSPTRRVEFLIEVHPASAIANAIATISIFTSGPLLFIREALSCQSGCDAISVPNIGRVQW
jgi:hypothetical protein